jgi:hypothetical protein
MAFDPDKYISEKAATQPFDPDAYLAAKNKPTEVEAAVRGFNQGATLGFADEAIAAIESALPWTKTTVGELAEGKVNRTPAQTYQSARDDQRALEAKTTSAARSPAGSRPRPRSESPPGALPPHYQPRPPSAPSPGSAPARQT